jgi:hypothetical protein
MANKAAPGQPLDGAPESRPAPAPAPIAGAEFEQEDTWMTFGLGAEGEDEERTVTVVFTRFIEDETGTDEFVATPFAPVFPGSREL